jgi:cysteine-rich repeat protein
MGGAGGPECGNGAVESPEECDDGNQNDADGCSSQCLRNRRVFVTSTVYNGNMGGLAGADARCQERADAGGLSGTFLAWLSDSTGSPSTRMTHGLGHYLLITGEAIATSWADLTDGQILRPIDRDELGNPSQGTFVCQGGEVWSNTSAAGAVSGADDCGNWATAANQTSSAGNVQFTDEGWTSSGCTSIGCLSPLPIYCFEQ